MESARAYKFRIYPDAKRQKEINERIILAQRLYNAILEKSKSEYQKDGKSKLNQSSLNRYLKDAVCKNKDFLNLYSQTRQDIFIRVQKSYQNFFRRVMQKRQGKKIKVGFPRFKSIDRYHSLTYPQDNGSFSIETKNKFCMLRISRIGRMKIELHRDIIGKTKTLTLKKEAGKYYAIFTAVKDSEPPKTEDTNPVGMDLGLNSFIALSDGSMVQKPKFMQERQKRLAKWQRMVSKRKKGSIRREKAKLKLQREWEYISNQSNYYLHKLSNSLVNLGYTSFAVEKLNIQNMAKNHNLAGAINNASWNKFIQMLSYKAESAGLKVIPVSPQNTSKTCSNCGNIQDMPLSERTYVCSRCGMKKDRDVNAAINILKRATPGRGGSHARGDLASMVQQGPQTGSLNREHTLPVQIGRESSRL